MMRVLLLGDGEWATRTLDRLLADDHEIPRVITRRDPSGEGFQDRAREADIPVSQPRDINGDEIAETIAKDGPDLGLSVSYDQIIGPDLLEIPEEGFINAHAGALPRYRGRSVLNWALLNGEDEIGLTIHELDEGIDTGPILLQRTLPVSRTDTYADVLEKARNELPQLAAEAVERLAAGKVDRRSQNDTEATYFPARGPGDEWIDWAWSSERIYNKIRALTDPGPGARTRWRDRTMILWEATFNPSWPEFRGHPGQVIGRQEEGVLVKTGDSYIRIEKVEEENSPGRYRPDFKPGDRIGADTNRLLHEAMERIDRIESRLEE